MIAAMQLAYLFPLAFMFKKTSKGEKRSHMEVRIRMTEALPSSRLPGRVTIARA